MTALHHPKYKVRPADLLRHHLGAARTRNSDRSNSIGLTDNERSPVPPGKSAVTTSVDDINPALP